MTSLWLNVKKKVLSNGLTIIAVAHRQIPKVSLQLWYNVGSKDEKTGEKGIAHLIEHMIFKGTEKLSESDINLIVHKLSGSCNAFTSHDYTGYLFDMPAHHWHEALAIMADCMRNCTFKQEFLNSELKAVIQELKMYNDDYTSTLIEKMTGVIFGDHPYHYPIIGFKQDLWSIQRESLVNFYKKHYVPNNATLVVVGDIDAEEVFCEAEAHFGAIEPDLNYKKESFYHSFDLESRDVTIYRDIKKPTVLLGWVVPGTQDQKDYLLDVLTWIIGSGKGSRLHRKLVDEVALAVEVDAFVYDMFEHALFFVYVQPHDMVDIQRIEQIIFDEIQDIINGNLRPEEITRATKKIAVDFLSLSENNQQLAYLIGKYFVATGNDQYIVNYGTQPSDGSQSNELKQALIEMLKQSMRPTLVNRGAVLPMAEKDTVYWQQIQRQYDDEDARILSTITRETSVETGSHVETIVTQEQQKFSFPHAQKTQLSNGLKVIYHHNPNAPKIDMVLDLKAKHFYDPQNKQGLETFVADMLQEGTEKYSTQELAQAVEIFGMSLNTFPGTISMSMLAEDLPRGLDVMHQLLTKATFKADAIEKVRTRLLADIANFWDNPSQFIGQLAREQVYKNHPYNKNIIGTEAGIRAITRDDLLNAYTAHITPQEARLAIVGDFSAYDIPTELEKALGSWRSGASERFDFPALPPIAAHTVDYYIARDQIVLAYTGLSLKRFDPDFDKVLLFDQIFTGGVLGSMSSRLFDLREQSGLFYTIGGSLLARSDKQPGMIFIKTIVSPDRLHEAEKRIEHLIDTAADTITQEELINAHNALVNSLIDNFASNRQMASAFLYLDQYDLPSTYFDNRSTQLAKITVPEIQAAVKRILASNKLIKIRVGRI